MNLFRSNSNTFGFKIKLRYCTFSADNSPGFSDDACRSMVAMMDDDVTGKLVFDEFNHLWNDICLWTVNTDILFYLVIMIAK